MDDETKKPALAKIMEREITDYLTRDVSLSKDNSFSQAKLVRRIGLFEAKVYPSGKFDSQGNYKYWYDIISPRADSEVKNVDFDTKNIEAWSPRKIDEVPNLIVNLKLSEWLRLNGQAEELNSAIEEGSGWGNIVWKKVKGNYERADLRNFYVINQTAQSLNDSAAIERYQMTQSDIRKVGKNWNYLRNVLSKCGQNLYKRDVDSVQEETTMPIYSIYERNGEVCLADLKAYRQEEVLPGDEDIFVYAKVIGAGTEGTSGGAVKIKYIVFAQEGKNPYKEYHRGRYKGRWWREGIYEILFDVQVRANEIGNQLAQGLQYAAKTIFRSDDVKLIQNVINDLKNGDIIKSKDIQQVEMTMQGFSELANEWNRIIEIANDLANSREVVQGITPASGTPLGTTQLMDINATKLFDFIREKISIPLRELFEEEVIPKIVSTIKVEETLRLVGDSSLMQRLREMLVEDWYIENLINLPPHSPEVAKTLKDEQMKKLGTKAIFLKEFRQRFEGYKAYASVVITGENVDLPGKAATYSTFIGLEQDPVRRSYLIEKAMRTLGIDVGELPRSTPEQLAGVVPTAPTEQPKEPAAAAV